MHDRLTRIETVAENREKLISDTRADLRGIQSDMKSMENRIVDKMDENQKWLVGLFGVGNTGAFVHRVGY